jgi:26S proteasome regulatory subunit N7
MGGFIVTDVLIWCVTAHIETSYLRSSRYLSTHIRYYVREMRIIAYAQLLESYRSLTLESMANAFGVSEDFADK